MDAIKFLTVKIKAYVRTTTDKAILYSFIFIGEDGDHYSSKKVWVPKKSVLEKGEGFVILDPAFKYKVEKDLKDFHSHFVKFVNL